MNFKVGDRVRVYCMHGHWDGNVTKTDDIVTSNQPKKAQRMIHVAVNEVGGHWQHPKQCRKLKAPQKKTITKKSLMRALEDGLTNNDIWNLL